MKLNIVATMMAIAGLSLAIGSALPATAGQDRDDYARSRQARNQHAHRRQQRASRNNRSYRSSAHTNWNNTNWNNSEWNNRRHRTDRDWDRQHNNGRHKGWYKDRDRDGR